MCGSDEGNWFEGGGGGHWLFNGRYPLPNLKLPLSGAVRS